MNAQTLLKVAVRIALPAIITVFVLPAFAEDVNFTTTGAFSCGTVAGSCTTAIFGGNSNAQMSITNTGNTFNINATGYSDSGVLAGDTTIGANGVPLDQVNAITFSDTATNNKGGTNGPVKTAGSTFTLTITQTAPVASPNSGKLTGQFAGTIIASSSQTIIEFSNPSLVIGNVIYTLMGDAKEGSTTCPVNDACWGINTPGIKTIGMETGVTRVTPEPTFMTLTGLGFAALAFVAYRRKRIA
jgi:hypothetical protein